MTEAEESLQWPKPGDQLFVPTYSYEESWNDAIIPSSPYFEDIKDGYKRGADIIVDHILSQVDSYDKRVDVSILPFPIFFLYWHYVELSLKGIIKIGNLYLHKTSIIPKNTHNLKTLWTEARSIIEGIEFQIYKSINNTDLSAIDAYIDQISQIDNSSMAFRYSDKNGKPLLANEVRGNLGNLKEKMHQLAEYFDSILMATKYELTKYVVMPAIMNFGQWAITECGIESTDTTQHYTINSAKLYDLDWITHVILKGWVEPKQFVRAYFFAQNVWDKNGNLKQPKIFDNAKPFQEIEITQTSSDFVEVVQESPTIKEISLVLGYFNQWVVTENGLECLDPTHSYVIRPSEFWDEKIVLQMAEIEWVNLRDFVVARNSAKEVWDKKGIVLRKDLLDLAKPLMEFEIIKNQRIEKLVKHKADQNSNILPRLFISSKLINPYVRVSDFE